MAGGGCGRDCGDPAGVRWWWWRSLRFLDASGVRRERGAASRAQQPQEAQQIARVAAHHTTGEARLVARGTGWAINGLAFYWTADDGRTWRTVEPLILRGADVIAKVGDVVYAGPGYVWMALNDIIGSKVVNGSLRYATIARTADGGHSWHESAPPECSHQCGEMRLSFVNAKQGFVLTASGNEGKLDRLFATANGGATWRLVGRAPFVGPITFATTQDGWGVSDPTITFRPRDKHCRARGCSTNQPTAGEPGSASG